MPTFAFAFEEIPEEIEENLDLQSGMDARRSFKVPWGNRLDFATGMLTGGGAFGTDPRIYNTGFTNVKVARARIRPLAPKVSDYTMTDPETQFPAHTWAKVTLEYQTQLADTSKEPRPDGTWVTYDAEARPGFMTLPGRALKWETDNQTAAPDAEASVIIAMQRHRFVWHNVATPDWDMLVSLRGKVNEYPWTLPALGIDAPSETMLFEGYSPSVMANQDGLSRWQITFDFLERRITQLGAIEYGWNHTYRENVGWDRLLDKDTGERQYARDDFDQLYVQL